MRRALLIVAVLAGAVGPACKRSPGPPPASDGPPPAPDAGGREVIRVVQIAVETHAWPEVAGPLLSDQVLAGRVWEGLSQSPRFEAVGRRPFADAAPGVRQRRARLRVAYGVEEPIPDKKGTPFLRALAMLTVDWAGEDEGPELWSSVACDGELPRDRHRVPEQAAALVECAITRGTADLVAREDIRTGELPAILKALDDPDAALRQVAFAAIGERHLSGAVPRLLELLHSSDELVRDGAIGALVALREPRAVRPLIDLAQFNDLDLMRRVIDAVGTIGGSEAKSYLELVAAGHDVPIIRELAEKALERMARRPDGG
jgi:hypothetical protein